VQIFSIAAASLPPFLFPAPQILVKFFGSIPLRAISFSLAGSTSPVKLFRINTYKNGAK